MDGFRRYVDRRFSLAVLLVAAFYFTLQILYVAHLPLVMDEFDGAYEAFHLRHALPYRDFNPYKTVLGYYAETVGTFASDTVWGRIVAVKIEIAIINTIMLAAAGLYLRHSLEKSSVVLALLLLAVCSTFLERSSELRVDMLTAWAGLWSLLLLLRGRYTWAGVAAGASFLISQKGGFYLIAGAIAIAAELILTKRALRGALQFAAAAIATIGSYVLFWGALTSFERVIDATFIGGANAALVTGYDIRRRFWTQLLARDPAYFLLTAFALWRTASKQTIALFAYSVAVFAQAILYPQPWPYFFVMLLPTAMVLQAATIDIARWKPAMTIALIALAAIYPLRRVFVVAGRHNDYQQYNVALASSLLGSPDAYLAGTDIIHDRQQSLPMLSRLGGPVIAQLRSAPPQQLKAIQSALEARPPKLVIGNYRIYSLPPMLLEWVIRHYARLSASIYLYAPMADQGLVRLAYGGRYWIDAKSAGTVAIDGQTYRSGTQLPLTAGTHRVTAQVPTRLRLIPDGIESLVDPRYVEEQDLYPHVYDY